MNLNQPLDNSEGKRVLPPHEPTEKPYENEEMTDMECVFYCGVQKETVLCSNTLPLHTLCSCAEWMVQCEELACCSANPEGRS